MEKAMAELRARAEKAEARVRELEARYEEPHFIEGINGVLSRENTQLRERVAELDSQAGIAAEMYQRVVAERDDWHRKASDFATRRTEREVSLRAKLERAKTGIQRLRCYCGEWADPPCARCRLLAELEG